MAKPGVQKRHIWALNPGYLTGLSQARIRQRNTGSDGAVTWRDPRPDQFVGAGSYGRHVNRTDRLYALVEELRACAPRRRSARELALLYEVSTRTIERDIGALQQARVPIYADAGPVTAVTPPGTLDGRTLAWPPRLNTYGQDRPAW